MNLPKPPQSGEPGTFHARARGLDIQYRWGINEAWPKHWRVTINYGSKCGRTSDIMFVDNWEEVLAVSKVARDDLA